MADVAASLKTWSTTEANNSPADATTIGAGLADNLQQIQATVRDVWSRDTIASASTTDLGSKDAGSLTVSGTTTITGLGTVSEGIRKWVTFSGALTLTHNATSLILPAGVNITTASGDTACFESLGSGNWKCLHYQKASGLPLSTTLTFADGTVSAPGFAFTSDTNTGIYRSAADTIDFTTGGVNVASFAHTSVLINPATTGDIGLVTAAVTSGESGDINLVTGNSSSTGSVGDIALATGTASSAGTTGGDIILLTGNGTSFGGAITIQTGTGATGGSIAITAGAGTSTAGGNLTLTAGDSVAGGDIALVPGAGTSGVAGDILLDGSSANSAVNYSKVKFRMNGGTYPLFFDYHAGRLEVTDGAGNAPVITSGAGTSPTINGTDQAFKVTTGATGTPGTTIRVTFANAWTNAPMCFANYGDSDISVRCSASTTFVDIIFATAPGNSKTLDVLCIGYR